MNFLAHLYLADRPDASPAFLAGNLLPDLHRGKLPESLPDDMLAGVHLHRRVDAFTDTHTLFKRSKDRIRDRHGPFSGILVDMYYDHFLAADWAKHHPEPLDDFIARMHAALAEAHPQMPPRMQGILERMEEQNWLATYGTFPGLTLTLQRMSERFSERLRRPVDLAAGIADLKEHYDDLAADFGAFMPSLMCSVGTKHNQTSREQHVA